MPSLRINFSQSRVSNRRVGSGTQAVKQLIRQCEGPGADLVRPSSLEQQQHPLCPLSEYYLHRTNVVVGLRINLSLLIISALSSVFSKSCRSRKIATEPLKHLSAYPHSGNGILTFEAPTLRSGEPSCLMFQNPPFAGASWKMVSQDVTVMSMHDKLHNHCRTSSLEATGLKHPRCTMPEMFHESERTASPTQAEATTDKTQTR